MALPQGIYFRATDNQTDPTDYDAEVGTTANYPRTSAQGNNVGWEDAPEGTRDRDVTTDVRLKGIHNNNQVAFDRYRIDLPSTGDYNIGLAFGDSSFAAAGILELRDGASVLATISGSQNAAEWFDATGVLRVGESAWVNDNALLNSETFATTIFRAALKVDTLSAQMAAVYIEAAAAAGIVPQLALMGVGT